MTCCLCMVLYLLLPCYAFAQLYSPSCFQKKAVVGEFGKNIQSTTMLVEDKDPRLKARSSPPPPTTTRKQPPPPPRTQRTEPRERAQLSGDGAARVDTCAQCARREEESAAGLGLAVEVTARGECRVLKVRGPGTDPDSP